MTYPALAVALALIAASPAAAQDERPAPFAGRKKDWPAEVGGTGPQIPAGWPDATACRDILTRLDLARPHPMTTEALMLMYGYGAVGCDPRLLILQLGIKPR